MRTTEKPHAICKFCGKEMPQKWDEMNPYYECGCEDAVLDRTIDDKIRRLNMSRPKERFYTSTIHVIKKIEY